MTGLISRGAVAIHSFLQPSSVFAHGALIGSWRGGIRVDPHWRGQFSHWRGVPGPRRIRKFQPVGEDVVTSDSEGPPFVGAVVSAPSTSGAHHDCRVGFKVRDDIRKRIRLTSARETHISEATPGEPIDDTNVLVLDLSGLGCSPRSGEKQMLRKSIQTKKVTQQDAPHLCTGPSRQLSPGHGSLESRPWFTSKSRTSLQSQC